MVPGHAFLFVLQGLQQKYPNYLHIMHFPPPAPLAPLVLMAACMFRSDFTATPWWYATLACIIVLHPLYVWLWRKYVDPHFRAIW